MIALALLAAVTPISIPQAVQDRVEICREGLVRWDLGDRDWLEREMDRRGLSPERKQMQRVVCLVYLQGAVDLKASLEAQGPGEAQGVSHGEGRREEDRAPDRPR